MAVENAVSFDIKPTSTNKSNAYLHLGVSNKTSIKQKKQKSHIKNVFVNFALYNARILTNQNTMDTTMGEKQNGF